jgi:hypothetical protein
MNELIEELAKQAGVEPTEQLEKFAELVVKEYAKKLVRGKMSNPEYVEAMDSYYEEKWGYRFD